MYLYHDAFSLFAKLNRNIYKWWEGNVVLAWHSHGINPNQSKGRPHPFPWHLHISVRHTKVHIAILYFENCAKTTSFFKGPESKSHFHSRYIQVRVIYEVSWTMLRKDFLIFWCNVSYHYHLVLVYWAQQYYTELSQRQCFIVVDNSWSL